MRKVDRKIAEYYQELYSISLSGEACHPKYWRGTSRWQSSRARLYFSSTCNSSFYSCGKKGLSPRRWGTQTSSPYTRTRATAAAARSSMESHSLVLWGRSKSVFCWTDCSRCLNALSWVTVQFQSWQNIIWHDFFSCSTVRNNVNIHTHYKNPSSASPRP